MTEQIHFNDYDKSLSQQQIIKQQAARIKELETENKILHGMIDKPIPMPTDEDGYFNLIFGDSITLNLNHFPAQEELENAIKLQKEKEDKKEKSYVYGSIERAGTICLP